MEEVQNSESRSSDPFTTPLTLFYFFAGTPPGQSVCQIWSF